MQIDRTTRLELIDMLTPHMQTIADRQALLSAALHGTRLLDLIPPEGAARTFASRIIVESLNFGEIDPGVPAILPILHEIKMRVGKNKATEIDALIRRTQQHPPPMHQRGNPNNRVFLSYRRANSSYIGRSVFQDLRAAGYDVFFDVEGLDSGDLSQVILRQIAARPHFVVILAPGSLERCADPNDWLRREIEYALETGRNVVPLLFNGFNFADYRHILTGKLAALENQNAVRVPREEEFFDAAMTRLRDQFLQPRPSIPVTPPPPADNSAIMRQIVLAAAEAEPTADELAREAEIQRREQHLNEWEAQLKSQVAKQQMTEQQLAQLLQKIEGERVKLDARWQQLEAQEAHNRAEQARLDTERERIRLAQQAIDEQTERERLAKVLAERRERLAAEQAQRERLATEQAQRDRIAAKLAELNRLTTQQAQRDRLAAEKAQRERIAAEQAQRKPTATQQAPTVPRLAWWNPLHGLLLLVWLSFAPQKLHQHEQAYGANAHKRTGSQLANILSWLPLFIMTFALSTRPELASAWQGEMGWSFSPLLVILPYLFVVVASLMPENTVAFVVAGGVAFGVAGFAAFDVAGFAAFGVAFGVARFVAGGVAGGMAFIVAFIVTVSVVFLAAVVVEISLQIAIESQKASALTRTIPFVLFVCYGVIAWVLFTAPVR